jgi:intraflagellar transport protein 81
METRLQSLRTELTSLKSAGTTASSDEKSIVFAQQQVIAQAKRLDQKEKQLADIQKARQEAEQQLQEVQKNGPIEVPSPAQFQTYVNTLKTKNENYRSMKAELDVHRKELLVMLHTEEVVKQQADAVRLEIAKIERARGVSGAREKRRELEEVSAQKADIDDMKGKTLEEMSEISKEIQRAIQARQNELKPIVAALQEERKKKALIEGKYLQAKTRFMNAKHEYAARCMDLEEECKKLRAEIATAQTKFHTATHQLAAIERTAKRAKEELKARESGVPISKVIKTYTDFFQKEARAMQNQMKELKEQKKTLGSESEQNKRQLEAFRSLRQLLTVKAQCQKKAQVEKQKEIERNERESHVHDEMLDLTRDEARSRDDRR